MRKYGADSVGKVSLSISLSEKYIVYSGEGG
jgi:hypothetical protein